MKNKNITNILQKLRTSKMLKTPRFYIPFVSVLVLGLYVILFTFQLDNIIMSVGKPKPIIKINTDTTTTTMKFVNSTSLNNFQDASMNYVTSTLSNRNYSINTEGEMSQKTETLNKTVPFPTTPSNKLEWIEPLNYTVDYGDKTCKEMKHGNQIKETLVQILKHWKSISAKYSIPYFLVYGSLIGAVRNSDFVPWDTDMDIMVDQDYYTVMATVDNKRNFVANFSDPNFHLVMQNDYNKIEENRQRINCLSQVKYMLRLLC